MSDITLEGVRKLLDQFPHPEPDPLSIGFRWPGSIMGMNVIEARERPVLQVSPHFQWCSDEARAEMNAYLLAMFGTRSIVPDGVAYVFGSNIVMSPRSIVKISNFT